MDAKQPSISIVVATYNRASSLDKYSLPALKNLTYLNYEIVVIDDGSTDNTQEVVATYQKTMKNLRIYKNDRNRGACFSRNRGVFYATGEIIVLMDDDVRPFPDCLEQLIKIYSEDDTIMAVWGCVLEHNPQKKEQVSTIFGNGSLWSMRRKVFDYVRFDTNLRYFGTSACDEHDFARRLQKHNFKITKVKDVKVEHFLAPADNRQWRGIGGDLNYLYEKLKSGSIWQYYKDLVLSIFLLPIILNKGEAELLELLKLKRKYKYKQILYTPKRILVFLKEKKMSLALQWLFYIVIDIPIRAKTKDMIEYLSRKYSKKWPA
ncbi:glycosyltransferase family 2 protein [Crocosphaera sp.]|uniref:glycosyltransferase family 2 protein n=1 Tax=Crocosphaera sp. TaxID=2729996 RepID=UPI003F282EE5|nr:glycosyltransferase family 2 protein [Crocosphaera sp.]